MSRPRISSDDARQRIIHVADDLFRRLGYTKTTVADIAAELGMSPANVYRYFPSKSAINEALCHHALQESDVLLSKIASGQGPVDERLATLIRTLNRHNRERFMDETRIHEMVCVAMEENWRSVAAHIELVVRIVAGLLRDGMASGAFAPCEPDRMALTVVQACSCLFHPMSISECMRHGRDMDDMCERLIGFTLSALSNRELSRP
ncbi:MAG: TetR family transcriptional regulator [Proteobacteria bacterium]|nr:TetR family transcriptional regulator [Pseudomonadota bacterium]